jgi:hypothetical protein
MADMLRSAAALVISDGYRSSSETIVRWPDCGRVANTQAHPRIANAQQRTVACTDPQAGIIYREHAAAPSAAIGIGCRVMGKDRKVPP